MKQNNLTELLKKSHLEQKKALQNYIKYLTPELEQLNQIRNTVKNCVLAEAPIPKFNNLMKLVSSINLMIVSHKKLSKNDVIATSGSENENVEETWLKKLQRLSDELNSKTFTWKIIKKIEVSRPLELSNYTEKIVQNNILSILESIYEPIFEKYNYCYGYKSHKSSQECLKHITNAKNQGLHWVIEGHIKGAFDDINPSKLAKMLARYINDKEFINLIYTLCITPTVKRKKIREESLENTPQKSIISLMLFNIYMHEFDLELNKILDQMKNKYLPINQTSKSPIRKNYKPFELSISKYKKIIKKYQNIKQLRKLKLEEIALIKHSIQEIIKRKKKNFKAPTLDYDKMPLRYFYNRYADDFIILLNKNRQICEQIKKLITEYLLKELKLALNIEKTKITNLKTEGINYLGYYIFMSNKNKVIKEQYLLKNNKINTLIHTRLNQKLLAGIDLKRVYNKLVTNKYAKNETLEPIHNTMYIKLEPQQIITHYNAILMDFYNHYYSTITYKSQLNRIYYILYCSALLTLACKHHTTVKKIHKLYGWTEIDNNFNSTNKTRIVATYQQLRIIKGEKIEEIKHCTLINREELQHLCKKIQDIQLSNHRQIDNIEFEDIWMRCKINCRTSFKLSKFCSICGSFDNLEFHRIGKLGCPTFDKKDLFITNILKNRKQIVVCKICHEKIHLGKHNNLLLDIKTYIKADNIEYSSRLKHEKFISYKYYDTSKKVKSLKYEPSYNGYYN